MNRAGAVAAAMTVVALATGCTGGSSPGPVPTQPTPTTSSSTPAPSPARSLAAVVAAGGGEQYVATYRATQPPRGKQPARHAQWVVWRSNAALRVDVVTGPSKATVIVTRSAYLSCAARKQDKVCFRARGESKAPVALRLDAARLFSTDLADLRRHVGDYTVTAAGNRCFAVRAQPSAPAPRVPRATYCFTAAGVVSAVRYPTGNTVQLLQVHLHAPAATVFKPYASPTPLPR